MTRVAVIAAGPSGLAQLRAFQSASKREAKIPEVVCFEKQRDWAVCTFARLAVDAEPGPARLRHAENVEGVDVELALYPSAQIVGPHLWTQDGDAEAEHVVGRNASNTEPARFVVVLLKAKGAAILTPVNE